MHASANFDSIPSAIDAIRNGEIVVVLDSEERENEGDLIMAAELATPESVNFMVTHGRGLLCAPMTRTRLRALDLEQMCTVNTAKLGTRFTISVDVLAGATTGISASDRALTLKALADPKTQPEALGRPGHVFPLEAIEGGTLVRPGHTEATVDLCRLAGLNSVGVLCEILSADGTMARAPELIEFAKKWKLKVITVEALIEYLQANPLPAESGRPAESNGNSGASNKHLDAEPDLRKVEEAELPTKFGNFRVHVFVSRIDGKEHVALTKGDIVNAENVLTRIHSECLTGDTFGSARCDCGPQLEQALRKIDEDGRGVLLYMRQEVRGIGLANKIRAYALQDKGADTVQANILLGFDADMREYSLSSEMLKQLGVKSVSLMTNNPRKMAGLVAGGIPVVNRNPAETAPTTHNKSYLRTKRDKLGHLFESLDKAGVTRKQ